MEPMWKFEASRICMSSALAFKPLWSQCPRDRCQRFLCRQQPQTQRPPTIYRGGTQSVIPIRVTPKTIGGSTQTALVKSLSPAPQPLPLVHLATGVGLALVVAVLVVAVALQQWKQGVAGYSGMGVIGLSKHLRQTTPVPTIVLTWTMLPAILHSTVLTILRRKLVERDHLRVIARTILCLMVHTVFSALCALHLAWTGQPRTSGTYLCGRHATMMMSWRWRRWFPTEGWHWTRFHARLHASRIPTIFW
mmetsp:Transcript_84135/g.224911  ORF Transcript_84135/g.224911 Transcript_84135/m.224911 type:complete len:249 (-) Transcript_84135:6193-6939(-)